MTLKNTAKLVARGGNKHLSKIWLIVTYAVSVAFWAIYGQNLINADMASEMVLADLLNESSGWESVISSKWYYSTEIRIGYLQFIFRIGLLLFPHNWLAARVFSHAVFLAILAGAYLFFCI